MSNQIKKLIKAHPLRCYILCLLIIKIFLAGGLSIYAIGHAVHDDMLMVEMAKNLLQGKWLGPYDNRRLIKGITFPVFLALNHITGIPFVMSVTAFYGAACALFTKAVQRIIKNNWVLGAIFTVLYLAPVNGCTQTLTRVYRNSIIPALVLLVFACFINMYFSRRKKGFGFWSVCAGVSLTAFWNCREDSIWLLPLAAVVCMLTMLFTAIENKKENKKWANKNLVLAIVPFIILFSVNTGIKAVNYIAYGSFSRIELAEGGFPELMKAIYSVEQTEDYPLTSVPKQTVDKLYQVSPTFAQLKPILDQNFGGGWDATDGELDGHMKDGWFFWCLRDCIVAAGNVTAEEFEAFCYQAAEEINQAIDSGNLAKRKGLVMPSALMSPWKDQFSTLFPKAVIDAFWYVAESQGEVLTTEKSTGSLNSIQTMEAMTHNLAIYGAEQVTISGWITSEDDNIQMDLAIFEGDECILTVPKEGGQDIYDHYASNGTYLNNLLNCRFSQTISVNDASQLDIVTLRNGEEIAREPLLPSTVHSEGDGYAWHIDQLSYGANSPLEKSVAKRVAVYETINGIYRAIGKEITVFGLLAYCAITVLLLKKRTQCLLDRWLILSGILGSTLVLCVGVAYTHISAYNAISPIYLVGGYPLLVAFNLLAIVFCFQQIIKRKEKEPV